MSTRDYTLMTKYEKVAAGATAQAIGATTTGKLGDIVDRVIIMVATSATGTVDLIDGTGSPVTFNLTAANTPIGVYTVELGCRSQVGGWTVTTGAGASCVVVGRFS